MKWVKKKQPASHSIDSFDQTLQFSSHLEPLVEGAEFPISMLQLNLQCKHSWRQGIL